MGERAAIAWHRVRANRPAARWWWHRQLKRPFFGRFMQPWRWPRGVASHGWRPTRIASRSHSLLAALWRETDRAPRGVVVCAHPMGLACKGFWLRHGHAQRLLEAGFHVVAYDFNGFGESPSTNFDYPGDAIAAGQFARGRWPGLPVHALAASFGAMKTLDAIDDPAFPYDRVVAEGCAPSLPQFWKAYPFAHAVLELSRRVAPAAERRLRPSAHIAGMRPETRVLLVHSKGDRWTPISHGDALAAAAPAGARLERLILERADHTHGLRDEADAYWPAISAFLTAD